MSSSNVINYSLRQNKCIERSIVFDGIRTLRNSLSLTDGVYVGLGSVWFADFDLAHRQLDIRTMVSIEDDETVFRRAQFNRPFRTLEVLHGLSADVVPNLLSRDDIKDRPWIIWLDYDRAIDEDKLDEIVARLVDLPDDSFLLVTTNANGGSYVKSPASRIPRLQELFGRAVPDDLSVDDVKDDQFGVLLSQVLEDFMISKSKEYGRRGGYVPAFRLPYKDTTSMVTVGGLLASTGKLGHARALVASQEWQGRSVGMIATPPLTAKEFMSLRASLPYAAGLSRADILSMGFDLDELQIQSFVSHYLRYPVFSQIAL